MFSSNKQVTQEKHVEENEGKFENKLFPRNKSNIYVTYMIL